MPNEFQLYFDARTSYRSLREPLIEQLGSTNVGVRYHAAQALLSLA